MRWSQSLWLMWCCSLSLAAAPQTSKTDKQSNVADCPAQLSMAYNANWLPYVAVTSKASTDKTSAPLQAEPFNQSPEHTTTDLVTGTDIELIRQIVSAVGSRLTLQFVPETRALQQLKHGQVDLVFAASYTPIRAEYAWFSEPYRHEVNVVVVHPELLQLYPELSDRSAFFQLALRKLIGTYNPTGFYGDEFELLKQNGQVSKRSLFVFEAERRLELVQSKRADYALVDQAATEYQWQQHSQPSNLVFLPFAVNRAAIHVMASKQRVSATCMAQIDAEIKRKIGSFSKK
jgi:polar amino acid transport system substrate-binding protein